MSNNTLHKLGIDIGSTTVKVAVLDENDNLLFSDYERHFANIRETLSLLVEKAYKQLGDMHPVNDSVYDIKLWERKSSSESPEKVYYDGLRFHYRDTVHIFTKRVTSGTETYRVNRRRVTRDKNPRIWYTLKLSSTGFVMSDSLVERKGASDEQHRKLLYKRYGRLTFREGKIIFLNSRCPAFYVKKEEK